MILNEPKKLWSWQKSFQVCLTMVCGFWTSFFFDVCISLEDFHTYIRLASKIQLLHLQVYVSNFYLNDDLEWTEKTLIVTKIIPNLPKDGGGIQILDTLFFSIFVSFWKIFIRIYASKVVSWSCLSYNNMNEIAP